MLSKLLSCPHSESNFGCASYHAVKICVFKDSGVRSKRGSAEFSILRGENIIEANVAPPRKVGNLNLELAKTNLKLTKSEGFYPNYSPNQKLPDNIVLCDSNVYEHKGKMLWFLI